MALWYWLVWQIEVYYSEVLLKADISPIDPVFRGEQPSIYQKRDAFWAGVI